MASPRPLILCLLVAVFWFSDKALSTEEGTAPYLTILGVTQGNLHAKQFFYNGLGLLEELRSTIDGGTYHTNYTYDSFNRPETLSYPTGFTVEHGYSSTGLLNKISNANTSTVYWMATADDARGNVTSATLGNGLVDTKSYDPKTGLINTAKATGSGTSLTTYISHDLVTTYEKVEKGGETKYLHYINAPNGRDNGTTNIALYSQTQVGGSITDKTIYHHRDHLGSIVAKTDDQGNLTSTTELLAYDTWGKRLDTNWTGAAIGENYQTEGNQRGYTDHEHLDSVGLIHMNGRVYDPELARFISPDPWIQDPYNTQSFNRYSYVWNNPLRHTDPTGELIFIPALIGGVVAGVVNATAQKLSGKEFDTSDFLVAVAAGAVVGGTLGAAAAPVAGTAGAVSVSNATIATISGVTGAAASVASDRINQAQGQNPEGIDVTKAVVTGVVSGVTGPIGAKAGEAVDTLARSASAAANDLIGETNN